MTTDRCLMVDYLINVDALCQSSALSVKENQNQFIPLTAMWNGSEVLSICVLSRDCSMPNWCIAWIREMESVDYPPCIMRWLGCWLLCFLLQGLGGWCLEEQKWYYSSNCRLSLRKKKEVWRSVLHAIFW